MWSDSFSQGTNFRKGKRAPEQMATCCLFVLTDQHLFSQGAESALAEELNLSQDVVRTSVS